MPAPVGTIFAELDLDASRYLKSQKKLLSDATRTTLNIEQNFKNLGIKSAAEMDLMRAKIENSFNRIKNSSQATANDIIRAEKAKNDQLKKIQEMQFGEQLSLIDKVKKHWIAATAAIAAASYTASQAWGMIKDAAAYEEQQGILDNLSAKYNSSADEIVSAMERASMGLIAKSDLMQIALSGVAKGLKPEELINLANAATYLGDTVGKTATVALQELTEALETGRTRSLKGYLGTTLDLEAAFGDLASKMTAAEKAQAMYAITMLETAKIQAQQKKAVSESADDVERLEAKWKNLTLTIKQATKWMLISTYDAFTHGSLSFREAAANAEKQMRAIEDQKTAYSRINAYEKQINDLKKQIADRTKEKTVPKLAEADARLKEQANDYRRTLESNIASGEAGGLRGELIKIQREADDLKDKFKGLKGNDKTIMYGLIDKDQLRKENEAVTKETERQRKLAVDGVKKETEETIKLNKDATDKAKDRLQAERDIYKDLRGYSGDYYEAQKQLIEAQAETYKKLGIDEVAIAQWVLKELRNAEIEKLKASDNFFDGWRAGLMQMQDDLMTWGKAGEEMFRSVAENGRSVMSDILFDGVNGELKSFTEYWKSFSDALLRQFTDIVAQMVVEWALGMNKMQAIETGASWIGSAVSLIGGLFGGGTVTGTAYNADVAANFNGGGLGFAKGAAFNHGRVTAFANGGVVSRPTLFPMANGMGLMGEAGPEAVMPLKRTSSGRLGVEGGGMTISVPVTINGDVSKGMAAKLSRAIEETVRKTVKDLM